MGTSDMASYRSVGRPATGRHPLLSFRSPDELTTALDAYIAAQPKPKPSRSEAIRKLIEAGLAAQEDHK